jgi:hypothetical protein
MIQFININYVSIFPMLVFFLTGINYVSIFPPPLYLIPVISVFIPISFLISILSLILNFKHVFDASNRNHNMKMQI